MKVVGTDRVPLGVAAPEASTGGASGTMDASAPSRSMDPEVALIEIKNQLANDGIRETTISNVMHAYHKAGMSIISNLKA